MSNSQEQMRLQLEEMMEVQKFMKGQIIFLYQVIFSIMEDLEPRLETSLSDTLAKNLAEFLKHRRDEAGVDPLEISALEEGLALLRIRFQHPPKFDE